MSGGLGEAIIFYICSVEHTVVSAVIRHLLRSVNVVNIVNDCDQLFLNSIPASSIWAGSCV